MLFLERDEGTEIRGYSGILRELCGYWGELKVERAGHIVVYREICVVNVASRNYRKQEV